MLPGFPSHPGGWENEDSSQLDSSMAFVGEKRGNATRQRERGNSAPRGESKGSPSPVCLLHWGEMPREFR